MSTTINDSNTKSNLEKEALEYHKKGRPGKLEITPTTPLISSNDLSLAYSPGVATPCLEIEKNPHNIYDYTSKGNIVAVISNGTAVLGLGNIGAAASKPVMEGKSVLFKKFADVNSIYILHPNGESVRYKNKRNITQINVSNFASGLYILKIIDKNGSEIKQKFIIK